MGLSGARGRGRPSVPPEPTPPPKAWGIVGGTFDPIHMGHLTVAEYVRDALDLGGVLFVPAAESPFKTARATSPAAHRVAMVELALADNDAFGFFDLHRCLACVLRLFTGFIVAEAN